MPGGVFLQPPSNQIIILTQLKMNPPGLRVFFGVLTLIAVAVYQIIRRFLFAHHTAKRIIITGLRYASVGVGFLYIIKEKHTLQTRANGGAAAGYPLQVRAPPHPAPGGLSAAIPAARCTINYSGSPQRGKSTCYKRALPGVKPIPE